MKSESLINSVGMYRVAFNYIKTNHTAVTVQFNFDHPACYFRQSHLLLFSNDKKRINLV